jgi:choline dehydrogenase-like flavoprotein
LENEDFNGDIYSDTGIQKIIIDNNKATHIEVENNGTVSRIEVERVILAGGSLNTPSILLNSGYKNPHLGKNLKTHPVSGVAGKFKEEQKPWYGSMQGMHSEDFLFKTNNYGYLLQGLPMHPSIFFPYFPNFVSSAEDFIESYNHWSGAIVLTSDTSSGSLINNGPLWKYKLNDFDNIHLLDGLTQLVRSYYLAGAEEIMVSASPTMHWNRNENVDIEEFLSKILSIKNQPYRLLLGSAHQMGTARINPNPEQGVVDLDGKVHGLENVYIVDASTFPRCSGVNPMISIQSMSHFLMSKI